MNIVKPNILLLLIILLVLITSILGQIQLTEGDLSLQSIRRVQKSQDNKIQPVIEITLGASNAFYVGGGYYCLSVGKLTGIREAGSGANNRTRIFYISEKEWKNLKNGDTMYLSWICGPRKTITSAEYERTKTNAFLFLNKKMLKKGTKK